MFRVNTRLVHALILLLPYVPGQAQEQRIGVVDLIRVLEASPQAEDARKQIEKEFAPLQEEVVSLQKGLRQKEADLAKEGAIMKDSERSELERDIISRRREIERKQEEYKEDLGYRKNEELSKIQRDIVEAIQVIAEEDKFDLILNRESLPYASEDTNVTERVLEELVSRRSPGKKESSADSAPEAPEQSEDDEQ